MIGFLTRHLLGRGAATAAASYAAETAAASTLAAEATVAASAVAAETTVAASTVAAGTTLAAFVPVLNFAIGAYAVYRIVDLVTSRMDACRITLLEDRGIVEMGKYRR